MKFDSSLGSLSDDELLRRLGELVSHSRRVEADLVVHIGAVDERRLYAREASPSMFAYCTERLHLSEAEAYLRITVARAARKHEVLLAMLRDGRLHLSGIATLVPLLATENRGRLLERAAHRSKRQILELVAELTPRPDAPALMRKLPQERPAPVSAAVEGPTTGELRPDGVVAVPPPVARSIPPEASALVLEASATVGLGGVPAGPTRRPVLEPLSPARYKVQFTASAELHDKLERLQALMRSEVPDGDLATIIERAVSEKLERLEGRRYAKASAPRKGLRDTATIPATRHVPAAVRRAVYERDGSRCGYVDARGRRCSERARLEFHHRHPFGMGGDHSPGNVGLLCRAHNRLLAECDYGLSAMSRRPRGEQAASGRSAALTPASTSPPSS